MAAIDDTTYYTALQEVFTTARLAAAVATGSVDYTDLTAAAQTTLATAVDGGTP